MEVLIFGEVDDEEEEADGGWELTGWGDTRLIQSVQRNTPVVPKITFTSYKRLKE